MEWYVFLLVIIIAFGVFQFIAKNKGYNIEHVILLILSLLLFLFSALRNWDVGADTISYINIFNFVKTLSLEDIPNVQANYWWDQGSGFKITYKYILKMLSYISQDNQIITIFNSCLLIFGLYYTVRNYSHDYWLSILIFICFGFFQTSINLIRIAITFFVCYTGVQHLNKDNNYLKFIIYILLAFMIHSASIFFLAFLIMNKIHFTFKSLALYLISACIILTTGVFASDWFINVIIMLSQYGYGEYFVNITEKSETLIIWGTELIFVLYVLIINKFDIKIMRKYKIDIIMFAFVTFFSIIAIKLSAFARLTGYFNLCLIYFIPNLLYECKNRRKAYLFSKIFLCFLMIIMYISRMSINNIGDTMPYSLFF